jgi:hypothetical protein
MKHRHTPDLHTIARRAVEEAGFEPDFPADVKRELTELKDVSVAPGSDVRDMRGLLWSSIDNRESRDLDQVERTPSPSTRPPKSSRCSPKSFRRI